MTIRNAPLPIDDASSVLRSPSKFWTGNYFGNPGGVGVCNLFNRGFDGLAALSSPDIPQSSPIWTDNYWPNAIAISTRAIVNPMGLTSLSAFIRSSDYVAVFGSASQGAQSINAFGLNDDTSFNSIVAPLFSLALHDNAVNGITEAFETTVASDNSPIDMDPYTNVPNGTTFAHNISCGFNAPIRAYTQKVSAGAVISQSVAPAVFRKGWVFFANAFDTSVGAGGGGIGFAFPRGLSLQWYNSSHIVEGEIWTDANGFNCASPIKIKVFTVGTLPAGSPGAKAMISDGTNTPTFGAAAVGGGLHTIPVYWDTVSAIWRLG